MRRGLLAVLAAFALALTSGVAASPADATDQIIVTPTHPQGWCWEPPDTTCADTRPGGDVNFVTDPTAPGAPHNGALQLTTDLTTTAKAQAVHRTSTALSSVTELSYWTKQVSGPLVADPAYQLAICANGIIAGACNGFTTLVYEPYQNGLITPGTWQMWDVDAGLFWSSRNVTSGSCVLVGTPGGPPTYSLSAVQSACPNAVVVEFIVNVGSNNPGYDVYADLFDFNGTIYNFEPDTKPGCRDANGQGEFYDNGQHKGNFSFTHHCKNGDNDHDEDSFDSDDRGDGGDFHSSSVSSVAIDDSAGTITMTGVGSSTGGLPVTFVLVALQSTAATPGWVSMAFGDGYLTAGDLVSGAITIVP